MNPDEMTPLEQGTDDPFERALLRAARRERAPEGSDRRVLAALGVGGAGGFGALVAKHAARLGPKGALATIAIGATLVALTHWAATGEPALPTEVASPPAAAVPEPSAAPSAVATDEHRSEAMPSTRVEDLPSSQLPPARPRAAVAAGASARGTDEVAPGGLAREVALVEEARAALARGDATAALGALDAHDREFPSGTLSPEARVLRIEALVRAGGEAQRREAHRLGDAFLAAHPSGPHARRVRAVLGLAP
ncbi:MAG: hypothetical protein KF764_11700 [Labilithrix sp.]|nr:hypothetical protein [Labilithrix sp.]